MTANRRIALNIVATYGRSLYSLVCGLFTARWVLMALGQQDYGLYGVIGGLTVFISFLCGLLSCSVGRFYAVSVGTCLTAEDKESAIEECRKWFSAAVFIHTAIPLMLMIAGWPLGEYAIRQGWIVVPSERMTAALWVFRFSCIACFVGMVSVPLNAMYTAKQYIAELTVYSFATTTLNVIVLYYMVSHPGVWLAKYAAWTCLLALAPSLIIAARAIWIFPECRLRWRYLFSRWHLRRLLGYAGWQAFGNLGAILRSQGIAILLNRRPSFGEMRNSSMAVANSVAGQTETLASAMFGAFSPAIFNAYGAGQLEKVRDLSFRVCKLGTISTMIFSIPMLLEVNELLRLWLKDPPIYAAGLCRCILLYRLIDQTSVGHMMAVSASGRIAAYQMFLGTAIILTLPIAWLLLELDFGIYSVGWAMILTMMMCAWGRVWFARSLVGLSARHWLLRVLLPLFIVGIVSAVVGYLPHFLMSPSLTRLSLTTALTEIALLPLAWHFLLDRSEKEYVCAKLKIVKGRFCHD